MIPVSSPITYASKAHSSLCYAMMRRECFSAEELRACLSGVFSVKSRSLNEAKRACAHLAKHGLLDQCSTNSWVITDSGKEMLYIAAHNHRLHKEQVLGKRILQNLHSRLQKEKEPRSLQFSMDFLDKEDEVLEEINKETKKRSTKQKR